ncbi:MAG: NAD-dependent epimerase/dehydratase family protein [Opitutales bacterium]
MKFVSPGSRVVLIGAGGGVGWWLWERLRDEFDVLCVDRQPLETARKHGEARIVTRLPDPGQWIEADANDYARIRAAVDDAVAVINLTVVRSSPEAAFPANVGGAYEVCRACADAGVRRLVHTGPWARCNGYEGDYRYAYDLDEGAPYAAGTPLYPHTKYLSSIIARAFAESKGLETFTVWISRIRPEDAYDGRDGDVFLPFSISWRDLAELLRCALLAHPTGNPYEEFFACAPTPQEKYSPRKAIEVLGWQPRDTFERFYTRRQA